jgi:PKD repeat protein
VSRLAPLALVGLLVVVMTCGYVPTSTLPTVAAVPGSAPWSEVLPGFASSTVGVRDLGPLASQPLTVGVALPPSNLNGLTQLINEVSTPGSPEYGHYLSPDEYEEQFSPTSAELAAAEHYYTGYGLTLQTSADRQILQVSGPSTSIASAFHTSFDRFQLSSGTLVYGPETSVSVPPGLGISGVTGFTDTMGIHPAFMPPTPIQSGGVGGSGPQSPAACSPVSGDTPAILQGQYGETPILSTYNGSGITVGIVDAYDSGETQTDLKSQLTSFSSGCGLPKPNISFLYPVRTSANLNSTPSSGWGGETILDIETVHTMAPGAHIDLALASDSSLAVYETVDFLVAYNLTQTISMSWGEPDLGTDYEPPQNPCLPYYSCNASWDGSYDFLHPIFAEAVAEGITPFSAGGDCGAYDGTGILTTDYPGSDPYVTDVGGTQLNASGSTYGGETGWSGSGYECTANFGGGGGGYAPYPRPWWQSGLGLSTTNSLRGGPDVSASAADGTSEATPIWAGLTAVGDQMHGGTGLGLIGPSLYAILRDPAEYAADFHDIVVGNNGYPCTRDWDAVTGIGSPDISNLLPNLVRYQPPSGQVLTVGLTASPGNTAAETFAATVSGGVAPYRYDFVPGLYLGQWAGGNSTLSYTYPGSGTYFATVEVWDSSGNWSESLPVLVQIGGTTLTGSLTPSATSVTVGTPVTFTTVVSGGTIPYSLDYIWGDGSYGYNGTSSDSHAYQAPGTYCPSVEVTDSATPSDGALFASGCITVTVGSGGSGLTASFTATPSSGTAPLNVAFASTVGGGTPAYSYLWNYGDGSPTSGAANPSHTYNASGTFMVTLTVTDSASHLAHAFTNVTVSAPVSLSATIAGSPLSGAPPLAVAFTSTVAGGSPAYTYAWTFGDGGTSTLANPSHTYGSAGLFSVSLLVTDSLGRTANSNTLSVSASSYPRLVATASATPTVGDAPLTVAFNGTASGGDPAYAFSWNFGDGSPVSTLRNPSHTYASSGAFSAVLSVTDQQPITATSTVAVTVAPTLHGAASAQPTSGSAPLTVTFNATATGGLPSYSWAWRFGDGSGSALENPTHQFTVAGTFEVAFWVNDTVGGTWATSVPVQVAAASPLAVSVGGPKETKVGVAVSYWAAASGGTYPYAFSWNFGDGTSVVSSGAMNTTTHSYASPGAYTVEVTVTDTLGHTATGTFKTYPTSGAGLSVAIGGPRSGTVGGTLAFWAAATGGAGGYTYTWTFGSGAPATTGSSNQTTYSWSLAGNYDVSVTVQDAAGVAASSEVLEVVISNAPSSSGGNLLVSGSLPSALGWLLIGVVVAAVAIAAIVVLRRRGSPPPPDEWTAPPIPGMQGPLSEPAPGAEPPPGSGGWAPPPPEGEA